MFGHWYVVANQKTVKIYTEVTERNRLKEIHVLDNPLGRERNSAFAGKQAGLGTKTVGRTGTVYYSQPKRIEPHKEAAIQFAKKLIKFLESEQLLKNFDSMTIVAEPYFLGKIRTNMTHKMQESVVDWIKKDLLKVSKKDLENYLLPIANLSKLTPSSVNVR